jgi:hypothetical protein
MKKIDKDFNFELKESYDVSNIINCISGFENEWFEDTGRQDGSIHNWRTISIILQWYPVDWLPGQKYVPTQIYDGEDDLKKYIDIIVKDLENKYNGKSGRVMLVNLPSLKLVTPHRDRAEYTHIINRFHIPIVTNDDVLFSVDSDHVNMKVGECWEVNNAKLHGCYNFGQTPRIHLMVDIIPGNLIGDAEYHGPGY